MRRCRLVFLVLGGCASFGVVASVGSLVGAGVVHAQGKLDARYVVTLAGIPIGRGAWVVDINQDQFTAAASGMTAGVMRVFTSGQGTGASRGAIQAGQFVPAAFTSTVSTERRTDEVRIVLNGGTVKDFTVLPPARPDPDRIPLTDTHMRGVLDPMTASLSRVPGTGDPVGPEACQRSIPVFDGRMRYNLQVAFKRVEKVKADKGYEGPVAVCSVYFVPIAGHDPDRLAIRYLANQKDMEAWLAPVAGTRVVVPYRVEIPTPIGLGVMQATQFLTTRQPTAAAKTQ